MVFVRIALLQRQFQLKAIMKKRIFLFFIIILLLINLIACQKKKESHQTNEGLNVITTLFPLYDFTKHIAREKASVSLLLPPGVEAHSFEPKPGDIVKINKADLFIYTGKYMEPWVESIIKSIDNKNLLIIDTSPGITLLENRAGANKYGVSEKPDERPHKHGSIDPHIWLDFENAGRMVDTILKGLVKKDPANKDYYTKNAETYKAQLDLLDKKYRESLSCCKKDSFIHGGHFAFNYLARRYNLKYLSAYPGSPDSEPTMKQLIALKKKMEELNIKAIFYEELITPRVAEMISKETGAIMLKLHGAHNVSKEELERDVTFLSLMEENLKNLKVGLQCQEK